MAKWDGGFCDHCQNTGSVDCHCGGDLCVCGEEEIECPRCHGASADQGYAPFEDDDDYCEPALTKEPTP